jgi:hypothetical protein
MSENAELYVPDVEKQEVEETGAERIRDLKAFVPRVDIYETDDQIVLVADVPGVDQDSVEITLEKSLLTVNGYVEPKAPEGYDIAYAEYDVGDFEPASACPTRSTRPRSRPRSRTVCYAWFCPRLGRPRHARLRSRQHKYIPLPPVRLS